MCKFENINKKGFQVAGFNNKAATYRTLTTTDLLIESGTYKVTPPPPSLRLKLGGGGVMWTVGLDAEWYGVENEGNIVLTYQLWVYEKAEGYLIKMPYGERLTIESIIRFLNERIGFTNGKENFLNIITHFSRAEFFAFDDMKNSVVNNFKNIRYVQRTFTSIAYDEFEFNDKNWHKKKVKVRFCDTFLLSGKSALKQLGKAVDFNKIQIGDYISRMNELYEDDYGLYTRYSMVDAFITADFFIRLLNTLDREFNIHKIPVTASQIGELFFKQGLDVKEFLGYETVRRKYFDSKEMKLKTIKSDKLPLHVQDGRQSYYGGRNEAYVHGVYENEVWYDYDIKNAYATAMLSLQDVDWESYKQIEDITTIDFNDVGYATVYFKFKENVKYPMFPTAHDEYGLIYVREGVTTVTLPELYTAMRNNMLERVEIRQSTKFLKKVKFTIPEAVSKLILERNKHEKGSLENLLYKLINNSIYGKFTQGINNRKSIDLIQTFTDNEIRHSEMGEGNIFNPFIASYITGSVRSMVSEYMNDFNRKGIQVINTTTDGFMIDKRLKGDELNASQLPYTKLLSKIRKKWINDSDLLEIKHISSKNTLNIAVKTRNYWMHDHTKINDHKLSKDLMIARGGVQTDRNIAKALHELTNMFLNADCNSSYMQTHLTSLNEYMSGIEDLTMQELEVSKNWDFDFKRKPVNAVDKAVNYDNKDYVRLCFDTTPFKDIEEFNDFKKSYNNYISTSQNINKITTKKELDDFYKYYSASKLIDTQIHSVDISIRNKIIQALLLEELTMYRIGKLFGISDKKVKKIKDSKTFQSIYNGEREFKQIGEDTYEDLIEILNKYLNMIDDNKVKNNVINRILKKDVYNNMIEDTNYFEAIAQIEI